jgi:galactose mutarotase-like enzyme
VQYFSVGAHPAFKVPLVEGTTYEDYFLEFSATENALQYPIASNGLIENEGKPFLANTNQLPLTKPLFYGDALIFKNLASEAISIKSNQTKHGLTLSYPNFPYMGIWAAKNANFVCIEPWFGLGDTVGSTGILNEKEGINTLEPEAIFEQSWSVSVF